MTGLSSDALRRALRSAGLPDASVRYDEITDSTNATALAMAHAGAPEWTLVAAGHQLSGRGRLGRTWESAPGESLLCSVVLRPALPPDRAVLLTLLAGAAMALACRAAGVEDVVCKWPNDLLRADAKVGGILAEAAVAGGHVEHVVVGVGLNLGGPPPGVEGAAGLGGVDAEPLLAGFLGGMGEPLDPGTFGDRTLARYRPLCATIGRRVRATTTDGRSVEGTAVDVDEAGALLMDTPEGRSTVGFGEVRHLR
ncbi:MAG TPA: biotin--[acetyl-CoA-carboxylase] ligase [Actinomycetota bacterium]|jgi:BirA family biotin operon repressor/biotin-[acetyl-CoA-carboxylase] ligase